jgi:hypothetical protein
MTNSMASILGNREFHEPREIQIIKTFVRKEFSSGCKVKLNDRTIVIEVDDASLAGSLRMHLHTLAKECDTKKRLTIRIV